VFQNSSYIYYCTIVSGNAQDWGYLPCANGTVQVVVTNTSITFIGTSSFTSNISFQSLAQIDTTNADGDFTGGEFDMTLAET